MSERRFPIAAIAPGRPSTSRRDIPWEMIAPHEAQARCNHGQNLERLAARGGLSPLEAVCVLDDQPLRWPSRRSDEYAVRRLEQIISDWGGQ